MHEPDFFNFFKGLGAKLREQRVLKGLTQEDMISHGFSARHWQMVEAGRPITLKTLVRACTTFGVLPSTLLAGTETVLFATQAKAKLSKGKLPKKSS